LEKTDLLKIRPVKQSGGFPSLEIKPVEQGVDGNSGLLKIKPVEQGLDGKGELLQIQPANPENNNIHPAPFNLQPVPTYIPVFNLHGLKGSLIHPSHLKSEVEEEHKPRKGHKPNKEHKPKKGHKKGGNHDDDDDDDEKRQKSLCYSSPQDNHCFTNYTDNQLLGTCINGQLQVETFEKQPGGIQLWMIPLFIFSVVVSIIKVYTLVLSFTLARKITRSKKNPIVEDFVVVPETAPEVQYVYMPVTPAQSEANGYYPQPVYPQQAYPQQVYPQQVYPQQVYPQQVVPEPPELSRDDQIAADETLARHLQEQEN